MKSSISDHNTEPKYKNEYSILKTETTRKNALMHFSAQLKPKLPKIKSSYNSQRIKSIENDINQINDLLHKKKQLRRVKPSLNPFVNILPMMIPPQAPPLNIFLSPRNQGIPNNANHPAYFQPHSMPPRNQIANDTQPSKQQVSLGQKQQKKKKVIPEFPKKSPLNRFRICAYAVYFTIYIKYFSRRFTENRRDWFKDRYEINNGEVVFRKSLNVLRLLQEIDMYKMIQDAKKRKNKPTPKQGESKGNQVLVNFIDLLLNFTEELMTSQYFIQQNHEVFTVGVLNQNFLISNLYTPQETAILNVHPHGYIQISQENELLILMLKIIIKILVYNFLLGIKFAKKWNIKQQKTYNLNQTDLEALWEMARKAAVFLSIVCEEMYIAGLSEVKKYNESNWQTASKQLGIKSAKSLEEIDSKKRDENSGSKMIKYLGGYQNMQNMIARSSILRNYKQSLKDRLIEMLSKIYTCLKYEEQKVYNFIRDMTMEENYVIFKGMKQDKQKGKKKKKNKENNNREKAIKFAQNNQTSIKNMDKDFGRTAQTNSNQPTIRINKNAVESKKEIQNSVLGEKTKNLLEPPPPGNPSASIQNISQKWNLESQQESEEEESKKRKMKFKYEQDFYDHKFDGHSKLQKLKQKMKILSSKKVL